MHSYKTKNDQIFHYDSGLIDGEITIVVPFSENRISEHVYDNKKYLNVNMNANDVLEFIAYCYIKQNKITKIEDMDWKELLK